MKHIMPLLMLTFFLILSGGVFGQPGVPKSKKMTDSVAVPTTAVEHTESVVPSNPLPESLPHDKSGSLFNDPEVLNSWAILFFAMGVLIMLVFAKPLQRLPPNTHMKLIVIGLVVFSALFLISAGFNSNQNAPAFGILGAILGYILGSQHGQPKDTPGTK